MTSTVATPERTQFQTVPALSIRLAASEGRGACRLLVVTRLESLRPLESRWSRLAEHSHVVAVDLPCSATLKSATSYCMSEPGFETIVFWRVGPSPSQGERLLADAVPQRSGQIPRRGDER